MKEDIVLTPQFSAWLKTLQQSLDLPPQKQRVSIYVGMDRDAKQIGSVEKEIATRLLAKKMLVKTEQGLSLKLGPIDEQLHEVALWLHGQGFAGTWRDEQLAVTDAQGTVHARVERAAVRTLGIATFAVHLVGVCHEGDIWLQRRALNKATDPGKLDTLVGGLVAAGESLEAALQRETQEEAGLSLHTLPQVKKGGEFLVQRPIDPHTGGYMIEHCHWYWAHIPEETFPVNQDGEVSEFVKMAPAQVVEQMLAQHVATQACFIFSQLFLQNTRK